MVLWTGVRLPSSPPNITKFAYLCKIVYNKSDIGKNLCHFSFITDQNGDDASIEFEYGHKKYRFSNFNEAYNYIEQLGNEALESYDKLKYLNDYDKDFLELKGKLEKITYAIRKYRWQNQK